MNALATERELLDATLAAAQRDRQTVTPAGEPTVATLPGVVRQRVPTHIDDRGSIVELFDPRWEWLSEPFAYAYSFTVRPGHAKGWGLHERHVDRYFLLYGEAELILYDVRPDSPTCGQLARYRLSPFERGLITIPTLVWHTIRNLGQGDVIVVNFPTQAYDHADPDKYRLPLDTPLIPYSFEGTAGW